MVTKILAIVLVLTGTSWGQATQPTTRQTTEAQFRAIIAGLQRQIADMKAENAVLKKSIADAGKPNVATQASVAPQDVSVGMSAEDAKRWMRKNGVFDCIEDEDAQVGQRTIHRQKWQSRNWTPGSPETIWIEDGKVVRVRRGDT